MHSDFGRAQAVRSRHGTRMQSYDDLRPRILALLPPKRIELGSAFTETKKARPVVIAVIPVLPPSEIPVALSTKAVTGEVPMRAPMEIEKASTQ